MQQSSFGIGAFEVNIEQDDMTGLYVGRVVSHPYGVRFHGENPDEVRERCERVLETYIGVSKAPAALAA